MIVRNLRENLVGALTAFCVLLLMLIAPGCKKKPEAERQAMNGGGTNGIASLPQAIRIHWLGKKRLATEANATNLMAIWNEPESARLEDQTLNKLAASLWRPKDTNAQASFPAGLVAAMVRPLLDDLLREEVYFEASGTNGGNLLTAIRLDPARSKTWETNFSALLKAVPGTQVRPNSNGRDGWSASMAGASVTNELHFTRSGNWTILGLVREDKPFEDFVARIKNGEAERFRNGSNYWLEAELDARQLRELCPSLSRFATNFATLRLAVTGDGQNVRTMGKIILAQPVLLPTKPFNLPTNLFQGPLMSFSAMRGGNSLLRSQGLISKSEINPVPDEFYVWGRAGAPFQTFFAFPVADANREIGKIGPRLVSWLNPKIATNYGSLSYDSDTHEVAWIGLAHAAPVLRTETNLNSQFIVGGAGHLINRANPMPGELAQHIMVASNMIFFEWENTERRLIGWRYLDDVFRIVFDQRGPLLSLKSASLLWIARNATNLSDSVTEVKLDAPSEVSVIRKSTIGLNGLEIDLLANWFENPDFPGGRHSLGITNPLPVIPAHRIRHNSAPPIKK